MTCHDKHNWWDWRDYEGFEPKHEDCIQCWQAYRSFLGAPSEQQIDVDAAWRAICPAEYQALDMALVPDKPAYDKVQEWTYGSKGLVAHGVTRRGKTRAMWQLIRTVMAGGRDVAAFGCVEFGHEVMSRCSRSPSEFVEWMRWLGNVDIVFLDDIGKLRLTDRAESELFGLVDSRISNQKPILATINMTHGALVKHMSSDRGAPFAARLSEHCNAVSFTD